MKYFVISRRLAPVVDNEQNGRPLKTIYYEEIKYYEAVLTGKWTL
jgi:hypothetical protein